MCRTCGIVHHRFKDLIQSASKNVSARRVAEFRLHLLKIGIKRFSQSFGLSRSHTVREDDVGLISQFRHAFGVAKIGAKQQSTTPDRVWGCWLFAAQSPDVDQRNRCEYEKPDDR